MSVSHTIYYNASPRTPREYRGTLSDEALNVLRSLIGTRPQMCAGRGTVYPTPYVGTHCLCLPLGGSEDREGYLGVGPCTPEPFLGELVQITTEWRQVHWNGFEWEGWHEWRIERVGRPLDAPVDIDPSRKTFTVDAPMPFGRWPHLKFDYFIGPHVLDRIEVFESVYRVEAGEDGLIATAVYDSHLRFHGIDGPTITLTTRHDSILGEIEIYSFDTFGEKVIEPDKGPTLRVTLQ